MHVYPPPWSRLKCAATTSIVHQMKTDVPTLWANVRCQIVAKLFFGSHKSPANHFWFSTRRTNRLGTRMQIFDSIRIYCDNRFVSLNFFTISQSRITGIPWAKWKGIFVETHLEFGGDRISNHTATIQDSYCEWFLWIPKNISWLDMKINIIDSQFY